MSVETSPRVSETRTGSPAAAPEGAELRSLLHRLNNQLGVVIAHAELLDVRAPDPTNRAHSAQIVASTLEAMGVARAIRSLLEPA